MCLKTRRSGEILLIHQKTGFASHLLTPKGAGTEPAPAPFV